MFKYVYLLLVVVMSSSLISGCGTPATIDNPDNGNQPDTESKITILLINDTALPVDPHLYISKSNLDADTLFGDADNLIANFDGSTTIEANGVASLSYDYEDVVTIGSSSASFGSVADWQAGISQDSPVLHQGTDFSANKVIVFRFSKDEQGNYHTAYTVADSAPTQ